MFDKKFIEFIPPSIQQLQEDLENSLRTMLQTALYKLDLVTREELEVQQELLSRTRKKLLDLEKKILMLEENNIQFKDNNNQKT